MLKIKSLTERAGTFDTSKSVCTMGTFTAEKAHTHSLQDATAKIQFYLSAQESLSPIRMLDKW